MGDTFDTDAHANGMPEVELKDYPRQTSLLNELYQPLPILDVFFGGDDVDTSELAGHILRRFSVALRDADQGQLQGLFFPPQSFYRDTLALTYHSRTFKNAESITFALLRLSKDRGARDFELAPGSQYMRASPTLGFIHSFFTFKTSSPRASCCGKMTLLPQRHGDGAVEWKIWSMATWLDSLEDYPEDETRLKLPSERKWKHEEELSTEVMIIGGGNMGLILAARLKALGVDYLIVDENKNYGDNWAKRYDFLRFHVPKAFCATPYLDYPSEAPEELTRDDLAEQMRRYGQTFDLNIIHETRVAATDFDLSRKTWTLQLASREVIKTIRCKHLALATGIGSWVPYVPEIANPDIYRGLVVHSHYYTRAKALAEQGIKSVLVIGSANTGFDVMEDCYNADLETTMIQRSPTYLLPIEYMHKPDSLGIYKLMPANLADSIVMAEPLQTGGQLLRLAHAKYAAQEPNRYDRLTAAGFQVIDSTKGDLTANLLERAGGHFIDMGHGVELLSSGEVGIKSGVVPTAFTRTGLEFSDGSTLDADAVIWCTGFKDTDVRQVFPGILGEEGKAIAQRMDAVWGLDEEGESRGIFKRHENVDNLWVCGYGAVHHRWGSKLVAMQIKADLEGILPPAYRETPTGLSNDL